ncbi:MAG: DUF86 domain-containing protein [bacterium]|nr:DUF86 domain-containing protein [bacterium]
MMRDPLVYIEDILESIKHIEDYVKGEELGNFLKDSKLQDSVIRRLEIIGEAIGNLPEETQALNPDIPWRQIAGLRNVLIHEYFGVNIDRVWAVVINDLPSLKKQLSELKNKLV